jgi:hypothetical protein
MWWTKSKRLNPGFEKHFELVGAEKGREMLL